MSKTNVIDWSKLRASKVHGLLADFPKCGIRYKTDGEFGIVLIHPNVANQDLVKQKINAAKIKATKAVYVVEIPSQMAAAARI